MEHATDKLGVIGSHWGPCCNPIWGCSTRSNPDFISLTSLTLALQPCNNLITPTSVSKWRWNSILMSTAHLTKSGSSITINTYVSICEDTNWSVLIQNSFICCDSVHCTTGLNISPFICLYCSSYYVFNVRQLDEQPVWAYISIGDCLEKRVSDYNPSCC